MRHPAMRIRRMLPLLAGLSLWLTAGGAEPSPGGATPADFVGLLSLVRYDMPVGRSDGFAPTRQLAQRQSGENGVDWPDLSFNGAPIFRTRSQEQIHLKLRSGAAASSYFQLKEDDRIEPGNHWLRPMEWRGGRRHIYTADKTARTANASETMTGRYELWTFPVRIEAEGAPVKIVQLNAGKATVFRKDGPWRSLTLLLPANAPGQPYELSVDSRPPVRFEVGLMPVKLGSPRDRLFTFDRTVGGDGPKIRVRTPNEPESFPHPKEWAADLEELKKPLPASPRLDAARGMKRYLGIEVPRSPITIYATQLLQGLSGGFYKQSPSGFTGSAEEYGKGLLDAGFDAVFDQAQTLPAAKDPESIENRALALARSGVKLGLQFDTSNNRPSLSHPDVAFLSHSLPDWHAPLYRTLSLAAQRFQRLPNFIGFTIGSSCDGYAPSWFPVPPIPDRPWGEAMIEFAGLPPAIPRAPGSGAPEQPSEYVAKNTADFLRYVQRYDTAFQQYGYFAEAVRQAAPRLVFTTGSFGSAPGPGARGGWPWASLPGRVMFEGLNVQQAYDWNQTHASKPLQNMALTDRLASYWPKTTTWSLLDNYQLLFGREAYQRACALALTRGIQGLGTNFLAWNSGPTAQPDVVAFQREMHAWIHRFGGIYAQMQPEAPIGIFYGQQEAVQRGVLTAANPPVEQLLDGSHEGKVTEALFLCHAAGWPARVISYQEVKRGPLPASMKAILLVGLKQEDASWSSGAGLEKALADFVARGGHILADRDSAWAAPQRNTDLQVAAYQPQSQLDITPALFARNAENIAKLREAMADVAPPIAVSEEPKLWAIPSKCGDVEYITAVNQAFAEGDEGKEQLRPPDPRATRPERWKTKANASLFVKPQTGTVTWKTERPIYDLRLGRRISPAEAALVDLTKDAFATYAVPQAEVVTPTVTITKGTDGFFQANVTVANPMPMRGIPVQITVMRKNESAELYGATGFPIRLPVRDKDEPGTFSVTATELLSGLSGKAEAEVAVAKALPKPGSVQIGDPSAASKFAARKNIPLTIGLTPDQEKDPVVADQARELQAFYKTKGRAATLGTVAPGGIVESLQPLKSPHRFPQWKTVATDLVLFGTPSTNVLLLDQARGEIFPVDFQSPTQGAADVIYTRSAFVGEFDVLNVVAADAAGITAAVKALTGT